MFNLSYCTADQGLPGPSGLPGYPGEEGGPVSSSIYVYNIFIDFHETMPFELLVVFVFIKW